jgi:hypothetical protein
MVVHIKSAQASALKSAKNNHTKAKPPMIDMNQHGRYRVSNLLAIFNVSHSTLYAGFKIGRYPKPDGYDGSMPFWKTETIRNFLGQ